MSGAGERAEPMVCPLCGFTCDLPPGGQQAGPRCGGCPLGPECDLSTCPHCGYTLAPRSRFLDLLRRFRKRREKDRA